MTNVQKKQVEEKSGVNPVVAAVAGVVVGAGIAVAGAFAADKGNQQKAKEALTNVEDKAKKLKGIAKDAISDAKNI